MGLLTLKAKGNSPPPPEKQAQESEGKFRNPPRTEKTEVEANVARAAERQS